MNQTRRKFLKNLAGAAITVSNTGLLLNACSKKTSIESSSNPTHSEAMKHWLWARPNADDWSAENWKKSMSQAKSAGIHAVLFQSQTNNQALFPHPNSDIPMKRDIVSQAARICHEMGVEFHAWMWTMPCNNPTIIKNHPDWYAVNREGKPAHTHPAYVPYYKFLDPSHPEVQEFVQQNVRALAKIPEIDGIHLDYVRMPDAILAKGLQPKYNLVQDREFPQFDYNYSEHARQAFKKQTGLDPLTDISDPSHHEAWKQFRYDSITHLVNNRLVPEAKKHHKQITAAVFPNWQSVRQEWHRWHLDGFLPMLYHGFYNRDIDFIEEETQKNRARLDKFNNPAPIYSGIYLPQTPEGKLQTAYQAMKNGGGKGIALFSLSDMNQTRWTELKAITS